MPRWIESWRRDRGAERVGSLIDRSSQRDDLLRVGEIGVLDLTR
jgi:hypothetical protein